MFWPLPPLHQQVKTLWLLPQGTAKNKTLTRPYNLWRTGVTTDGFTPKGAVIMAVSVLLYGIIQVWLETRAGTSGHAGHVLSHQVPMYHVWAYS